MAKGTVASKGEFARRALLAIRAVAPGYTATVSAGGDEIVLRGDDAASGATINLDNFYNRYAHEGGTVADHLAIITRNVAQMVADLAGGAGTMAVDDWDHVAPRLRVQLVPAAQVAPRTERVGDRDHDIAAISRPFLPGLALILLIDYADRMARVIPEYLAQWGQDTDALLDRAVAQTRAMLAAHNAHAEVVEGGVTVRIWESGDTPASGYDATRLAFPELLADLRPAPATADATLLFAPDRDFFLALRLVGHAALPAGLGLLATVARDRLTRTRRVAPYPYFLRSDGTLRAVAGDERG